MNMPARQFFAMLKASDKLLAMERLEECDIAAIPMCHPDYYRDTKRSFLNKIVEQPNIHLEPRPQKRGVVDSSSEEARYALSRLMANLKRSTH